MRIEVTTCPASAVMQQLSEGIQSFNRKALPGLEAVREETRFAVLAHNEQGVLLGGIRANAFWNTLHIELLWLDAAIRGQGVGSKLLQAAEHFATDRGYVHAYVETTDWQARPFYEQHGYIVFGRFDGQPEGHSVYFMKKSLENAKTVTIRPSSKPRGASNKTHQG